MIQQQQCMNMLSSRPFTSVLLLIIITKMFYDLFLARAIPSLQVPMNEAELSTDYDHFGKVTDPEMKLHDPKEPGFIQCYDPATAQKLGKVPIVTPEEVQNRVNKAREAQKLWSTSTFEQRRHVLRIMMKFIIEHQDDIVRLAVRDSGKTELGASFGEVLPSCEKIQWMIDNGELVLKTQKRESSRLMLYKNAWVEYVPLGVLGIISPFNYPFHNFINHIISGLFSGNSVVCKVSEHTSWSADYFHRFVKEALIQARGKMNDIFVHSFVVFCNGFL
jgi:acyl-CoA reductase-like NAD-dependent aldehyde dehydrogenase